MENIDLPATAAAADPKALFIFGSFSEGMFHYEKIQPHVETQRPVTVRGALYRMPSGLIVMSNLGTQTIAGQLVTLRNREILLALLDQFHGVHRADPENGLFFSLEIEAYSEEGESERAQAYCINTVRLPRGAQPLPETDWRRTLVDQPPLFARLSDRQRSYIQKLGASTGREIVPIDLQLYRELMHLEIVVDKGRRLALSSLGHELYWLLSK